MVSGVITTLPLLMEGAIVTSVAMATVNGRPVGTSHYHYKGRTKKAVSHKHEGGHLSHTHRGLQGYGRTRKSLRR